MIKLSITFLLIIFQFNLKSQVVARYYEYINEAEMAFYNGDLPTAQAAYKNAFTLKDAPQFASNLYNYGYISILLKDYRQSYLSFKKVIELGLSTNRFKNNKDSIIKIFLAAKEGKQFLKEIDSYTLDVGIDKALRAKMYRLTQMDRKYRLKENGYTAYRDSMTITDHAVVDSLLEIFKEYKGIPTERKIGIDTFDIISPIYFYLLVHQSEGTNSRKYDFSEYIKEAVRNGNINNSVAADLLERANSTFKLGGLNFQVLEYDSLGKSKLGFEHNYANLPRENFCVGFGTIKGNTEQEINDRRTALYLPTLKQRLKMFEAQMLNQKHNLPLSFFVVQHFIIPKKEDFDHWCNQLNKF